MAMFAFVASPVVVQRKGIATTLSLLLAGPIEALLLAGEVTHSSLHITLEERAQARRNLLLSMSTSSLLFPHDWDAASFLLFSCAVIAPLGIPQSPVYVQEGHLASLLWYQSSRGELEV